MLEPSQFKTNNEIVAFIKSHWNLGAIKVVRHIDSGSANLYEVSSRIDYIFKEYESDVSKENILMETKIVKHLQYKGLPVTKYEMTTKGELVLDIEGRYYTLMHKLNGNTLDNNSLGDPEILTVAKTLAQVNVALDDFVGLPIWERAGDKEVRLRKLDRLIDNIKIGNSDNKEEFLNDLVFKKEVYTQLLKRDIETTQFTFRNSNGDFSLRQMLFDNDMNVTGILDFDRASKLPIVWEIMRSYIQSSVHSKEGNINIKSFVKYVEEYMKYLPLTKFDLENMAYLYLMQLTPSTHGYNPDNYVLDFAKKKTYKFGKWRTAIIKWLSENEQELTNKLVRLV